MMMNITTEDMNNAVKAFQKEGIKTDYSNIITILMGVANADFMVVKSEVVGEMIENAYINGYDIGVEDCADADHDFNQELNDAYAMGYYDGYNEQTPRSPYDGTSDDNYEEPENTDDDFRYDHIWVPMDC